MAEREYSNGLQHLKFMQRAKQREEAAKKAEEVTVADDSHWVVHANVRAAGKKCNVILEGDPKPGALLGRMSFQNCNISIDKMVEEAEALQQSRFSAAKEKAEAALSTSMDSLRTATKGENRSNVMAEESTALFKKPKVGAMDNFSARVGARGWQSPSRNYNKTWQGWRSPGDYRMLRPLSKG